MKCETVQDDLSAYLDGELPADARAAVDAHIKDCPSCQTMLEELKSVASLVSESPRYTAPANFAETVHHRVAASPAPLIIIGGATPSITISGANTNGGGYQPRSMWGPVAMGLAALVMLFVLAFAVMPALEKNSGSGLAKRTAPRATVEEPVGRPEPAVAVPETTAELAERGLGREVDALKADNPQAAPIDSKKHEEDVGKGGGGQDLNRLRKAAIKDEPKGDGDAGTNFGAKNIEAAQERQAKAAPANELDAAKEGLNRSDKAVPTGAPGQANYEPTRALRNAAEAESKALAAGAPPKPINQNGTEKKGRVFAGGAPAPAPTAPASAAAPQAKREEQKLADAAPGQNALKQNDPEPFAAAASARGARELGAQDGAPTEKAKAEGRAAPKPGALKATQPTAADPGANGKKDEAATLLEEAKAVSKQASRAPAAKRRAGEAETDDAVVDEKAATATLKKQATETKEVAGKAAQLAEIQPRRTLLVVADEGAFVKELKSVVEELGGKWTVQAGTGRVPTRIALSSKNYETFHARLKELKSATALDAAQADAIEKSNATLTELRSQAPDGNDVFVLTFTGN